MNDDMTAAGAWVGLQCLSALSVCRPAVVQTHMGMMEVLQDSQHGPGPEQQITLTQILYTALLWLTGYRISGQFLVTGTMDSNSVKWLS